MTPEHLPRLARAVAPAAALLALTACLAGCRGAMVTASSAPPASAGSPAAAPVSTGPAAATTPAASSAAAGGAGSVTVSISSPASDSGSVAVPVSCVTGLGYRASVTSAVVQGDQVAFSVDIPRYPGPGTYYAVVTASLRQSSGVVTAIGGVSRVPAAITSAGGSFTVSATGSGGRTFAGSLSWTCGG
jgi:hypothetical protein